MSSPVRRVPGAGYHLGHEVVVSVLELAAGLQPGHREAAHDVEETEPGRCLLLVSTDTSEACSSSSNASSNDCGSRAHPSRRV